MTSTIFRVATINVHSFHDPSFSRKNATDLIDILSELDLDLIAAQEIQRIEDFSRFAQGLRLPHVAFGISGKSYLENGIASRYPIQSQSVLRTSRSCGAGTRSLLKCSLDGDHPFVQGRTFAVTHLDHINEQHRIDQMETFNPLKEKIDVLLGDMNSLTREDYSDDYFQREIVQKRELSKWEVPCFDLTQLLTKQWSFQDAFKQMNPHLKDTRVTTCRFGTRIDYIYFRPSENDRWTVTQSYIVDTKGATDHNAVVAVFEQKQN